jgi:hypothetical protein
MTCDGTRRPILLNRDLKAGDSYRVPTCPAMTWRPSNAGAVEVDLDGSRWAGQGARKRVGRVSLDPQSLATVQSDAKDEKTE